MKKYLISLLLMFPLLVEAQYCSPATTNVAISPTTTVQYTATYTNGKRAFNFPATAGCVYTFSTCGFTTVDTYLRLYSTSTGGTLLTTSDDYCSTQSQITWTCVTTGTYSILLTKYSCVALTASTYMSYVKSCPVVATNDNCASAIAITLPYTSAVTSTVAATSDVPTSVSSCAAQGKNIWYSVVGNNTTYTATTCDASTNFDTEVRILTGACSTLNSMTEVTCNDDDLSCSSSTRSTASWCAEFGLTYYISVGGYASTSGDVKLTVSSTGVACSALPIELLSFDVYMIDTAVNVKWSTATETNCDYFTVERSTNGIDWKEVSQVNGNGTSSTIHFYNTVDLNAPYGYSYYRLKEVDYNGQYEIYPIKSVYKPFKKRNVTMMVNILGQQINDLSEFKGVFFMIYDDGSIEKRVKD